MKGKDVSAWREAMGWSQEQAAAAMSRTRRQVQEIENSSDPLDRSMVAWLGVLTEARQLISAGRVGQDNYMLDVMTRINEIDAMPKPGRPAKSARETYIGTLERLLDTVLKNQGTLDGMLLANAGGPIKMTLGGILAAAAEAVAARQASLAEEAKAAADGDVINRRIPRRRMI